MAVPSRALGLAQALGVLPAEVFLVGCEPGEVEELTMDLSPAVGLTVEAAVRAIEALLAAETPPVASGGPVRA